jgi:hypothetical protein
MSGFFRSVLRGFAVEALVRGAHRAVSAIAANNAAQPALPPANYVPQTPEDDGIPFYEKRVFGTPGASLYDAYALDWDARQAGIDGEVRVGEELERLAALYPNTYVFHSVKLPGKVGDIDHLVIQGNKMLLVDSKNWKHDASYHIYHSTFDADFLTRDGEEFKGGEIHLTRQIAEWQVEFMDSTLDVQAVLVIANRKSSVSESINAPYSLANISGLATVFGNVLTSDEVAPLHPLLLNRVVSMVQQVGVAAVPTMSAPARVRQPATKATKWLVGWSFFNYTVMMLLFPLAGISAIPLLVVTYRHQAFVKANQLGGGGLLTAVLVFTYILLVGWAITLAMVIMYAGSNFFPR